MSFVGTVCEPLADGPSRSRYAGACFALRSSTLLVTADHVVEEARRRGFGRLWIRGAEVDHLPVLEVMRHSYADLALLRVAAHPAVRPFMGAAQPVVGAPVHLRAWRRAWDELDAVIVGEGQIVRARYADTDRYYSGDVFTLDAFAGPGFSGSPAVNGDGEVVGVVSGNTSGEPPLGLAVHVDDLMVLIAEYIDHQEARS